MEKTEVISRLNQLIAGGMKKVDIEKSVPMTKNSLANFMKDDGKRMPQIWVDRLGKWLYSESDPQKGTITCAPGSLVDQTLAGYEKPIQSAVIYDGQGKAIQGDPASSPPPGIDMEIRFPMPAWIKEIEEYCAVANATPAGLIDAHRLHKMAEQFVIKKASIQYAATDGAMPPPGLSKTDQLKWLRENKHK